MRAVLLADTHLRDGSERDLDDRVLAAIAGADVVLHAGDVTGRSVLDRLATLAPVHAVLGNNDAPLRDALPVELDRRLNAAGCSAESLPEGAV